MISPFNTLVTTTALGLVALGLPATAQESELTNPERWTWSEELTAEQIERLTPMRDDAWTRLDELGPSPEQRRSQIAPSDADVRAMWKIVESWNTHGQNGDEAVIRATNRDRLLDRYGVQALPVLVDCLESDSYWFRRTASQACAILVKRHGDDVRWLLYDYGVPKLQVALFGAGPIAERIGLRQELHRDLQTVVTGNPLTERERELNAVNRQRIEVIERLDSVCEEAWSDRWRDQAKTWIAQQEQLERERDSLLERLRAVRSGDADLDR